MVVIEIDLASKCISKLEARKISHVTAKVLINRLVVNIYMWIYSTP